MIKKVDYYENIYSVNPFHLIIGKVDGFIEEKNGSKYCAFDFIDKKKKYWQNTQNFVMA